MANHASAKKRIRQTAVRTARNRHIRSTVRTFIKRVRQSIQQGDQEQARNALHDAVRRIDASVSKGVYHRRTASRYIARLSKQVHAMKQAA